MDPGDEPPVLDLQRGQLLGPTCVLNLALGLAKALGQDHRRGLIHEEYAKTRTKKAHSAHYAGRCPGSPAAGSLNGSSSPEENFTKG
jgi:hypothetical protein